ncbi:MAG: hypothetical protein FWD45_05550 [Coriobacteriia bacterium]|nr:hypothetical protein [Coriobacteriia bacterium]
MYLRLVDTVRLYRNEQCDYLTRGQVVFVIAALVLFTVMSFTEPWL